MEMMNWKIPVILGSVCSLTQPWMAEDKLKEEEVVLRNGGTTLAGTMTMPSTKSPCPALVIIHAAGFYSRKDYPDYVDFFARLGIAVLAYDMRDPNTLPSFHDLAEDALAGVQFLRNRQDIDPHRIGLWSLSRGGYTAPLVFSRFREIAFMILVAAPVVTPAELEINDLTNKLRSNGFSPEDTTEAVALFNLVVDVGLTGEGWGRLNRLYSEAKKRKWFKYFPLDQLPPKGDGTWRHIRQILKYNPVPILETVTCPVLSIYGEMDQAVPVAESIKRTRKALEKAGNKDYTVKVFPKADHTLESEQSKIEDGRSRQGEKYAPGYFETMSGWLTERLKMKSASENRRQNLTRRSTRVTQLRLL
jgi:uncharacterized protein